MPEGLGMKHLIDDLEVGRSDRIALYPIKEPADEPELPSIWNAGRAKAASQDSSHCSGAERMHPVEFDLGLADLARLLQRGGVRIGASNFARDGLGLRSERGICGATIRMRTARQSG